jgi:anti-anti-sigma regulatory factor
MLEIQTKHVQPDIVVLELTGRITIGRDCKQLEWAVENLVKEGRKKVIFDLAAVSTPSCPRQLQPKTPHSSSASLPRPAR